MESQPPHSKKKNNLRHKYRKSLSKLIKTTDVPPAPKKGKPKRKRKKLIFNGIRDQMEFYFGDANLSKDRFLSRKIEENPFVPLSLFMTFNKIKAVANSEDDIVKSLLSGSNMLELSEDKKSVRRTTPIVIKENVDECTIYVESLPLEATHDWVRNIFESYGPVAYVSIPRYKKTRMIKEFAFVEFEQPSSVRKALMAFKDIGCILNKDNDIAALCSISSFNKEQKELADDEGGGNRGSSINVTTENNRKKSKSNENNAEKNVVVTKTDKKIGNSKRVTEVELPDTSIVKNDTIDESEHSPTRKKQKIEDPIIVPPPTLPPALPQSLSLSSTSTIVTSTISSDTLTSIPATVPVTAATTTVTTDNISTITTSVEILSDEHSSFDDDLFNVSEDVETKKKRVRQRKTKLKEKKIHTIKQIMLNDLRITSKLEWKRLRNSYLNLQRQQVRLLKKHVRQKKISKNNNNNMNNNKIELKEMDVSPEESSAMGQTSNQGSEQDLNSASSDRNKRERDASKNITFYETTSNNRNKSIETNTTKFQAKTAEKLKTKIPFEPGVIIQVQFTEPCTNVKEFKEKMRKHSFVKYIDVREGDLCAYIRINYSNAAPELIKACAPKQCTILSGELEQNYWEKINSDRQEKFTKVVRIKPKRGREKMQKIVAKHIFFNDDDDVNDNRGNVGTVDNICIDTVDNTNINNNLENNESNNEF